MPSDANLVLQPLITRDADGAGDPFPVHKVGGDWRAAPGNGIPRLVARVRVLAVVGTATFSLEDAGAADDWATIGTPTSAAVDAPGVALFTFSHARVWLRLAVALAGDGAQVEYEADLTPLRFAEAGEWGPIPTAWRRVFGVE